MKKGIILSSLLLFFLASTAGKDLLFHFNEAETNNFISESSSSPANGDESRFLVCEDTEEMEGRSRVLPVLLILDKIVCTPARIKPLVIKSGNIFIQEIFLVFPLPLRAPPAPSIVTA